MGGEDARHDNGFCPGKSRPCVPTERSVQVIETPEFRRGVAIAYCDSPGPLDRTGATFYAIEPTPSDWKPERVESFYREYNEYMLQDLTIHEAMPGHFLQGAHANQFGGADACALDFPERHNGRGLARYGEQVMAELGYGGPEVKMQQLKMHPPDSERHYRSKNPHRGHDREGRRSICW